MVMTDGAKPQFPNEPSWRVFINYAQGHRIEPTVRLPTG
jgi:hypothetical protein